MKKNFLVICYLIVAFTSFGQAGKLKKADNYLISDIKDDINQVLSKIRDSKINSILDERPEKLC